MGDSGFIIVINLFFLRPLILWTLLTNRCFVTSLLSALVFHLGLFNLFLGRLDVFCWDILGFSDKVKDRGGFVMILLDGKSGSVMC